eukprot:47574_1
MGNEHVTQKTDSNLDQLQTYEKLIWMGFDEDTSWKATQKFNGNLNKCIDYVTKRQNKKPIEKEQKININNTIKKQANRTHTKQLTTIQGNQYAKTEQKSNNTTEEILIEENNVHSMTNKFDQIICQIQIDSEQTKHDTSANIANKLAIIYITLLNILPSNMNDTDTMTTLSMKAVSTLYDKYYDIKFQIMKETNNELLYKIYHHLMNSVNEIKCDFNTCKYVIHRYRNRETKTYHKYHIVQDLLTEIHCFILHSFETNLFKIFNTGH